MLPVRSSSQAVGSLQLTAALEERASPVITPVFMEETLEVQRHFFPLCRSFLVLTQKPLTAQHCQTHFGANTLEVTVAENHHSLPEDSSWSAGCVRAVLVITEYYQHCYRLHALCLISSRERL